MVERPAHQHLLAAVCSRLCSAMTDNNAYISTSLTNQAISIRLLTFHSMLMFWHYDESTNARIKLAVFYCVQTQSEGHIINVSMSH